MQLALRHRLLSELKLSVNWLYVVTTVAAAVVAASQDRRNCAVVDGQPIVKPVCGIGYTKNISPAPIWRPGERR